MNTEFDSKNVYGNSDKYINTKINVNKRQIKGIITEECKHKITRNKKKILSMMILTQVHLIVNLIVNQKMNQKMKQKMNVIMNQKINFLKIKTVF